MFTEDTPFLLLKKKMESIRVARFSAEINSLLQLPNNIVTILDVEDKGFVWFFTYCKKGFLQDCEKKTFYAYLDFHQRNTGTRIQARGIAQIITEKEELKFIQDKTPYDNLVLIKLKVMHVEYTDDYSSTSNWKEKIKKNLYHLIFRNHEKVYDFS